MYRCDHCPYETKVRAWLKKHLASVHVQHRPFQCDRCGSSFKMRIQLINHQRTHDAKTWKCNQCSFTCTQKRILNTHRKVHSESRPYACKFCAYRCKRKGDMPNHVRCMHSGRPCRKRREENLATTLDRLGLTYVRERVVNFQNSMRKYAKVDFFLERSFGFVLLECDERSHKLTRYTVVHECLRMQLIRLSLRKTFPSAKIHIIRYNPDPYRDRNAFVVKRPPEDHCAAISEAIEYQPDVPFMISYIFYRTLGDLPEICQHEEYTLLPYVRRTTSVDQQSVNPISAQLFLNNQKLVPRFEHIGRRTHF